ncbi:MAG TPA: amidohydrolase family protein [Polyangiales bacterium]|nr:amidohydrolase family protein [Polyangiales bacterium]
MRGISGSWLLIGDASPAIARGAVLLDATERVLAVGSLDVLRREHPSVAFQELPAVLTPGLVNAHTHLELSGLRGRVPGGRGFVPWVDTLVRTRAQAKPELDTEAIDEAISELLAAGVMGLGDVTNRLNTVPALAALPIAGCVFHEVFGMRRDTAEVTLGMAVQEREQFGPWPVQLRYALAPHTPFTLHPEILREIALRCRAARARTSLHLCEHAAERAFLESGGGPFREWIASRDASPLDWQPPACGSVEHVRRLGVLGPDVIVVHLTDARPAEVQQLAAAGAPVVLCPRSNLHIELKLPPLLDILGAGIRPGLGTDSLASNTSLDPLAEARALAQRFPTVPAATLLAMACAWGADALGLGRVLGRLQPGAFPGVLAFEHGASAPADPERYVIQSEPATRRIVSRPHYPSLPAEVFA